MPTSAPSRSTQKLTLTIGMIPLALDIFSAVEESSVRRSQYVKHGGTELHKVGVTPYDTVTGVNVSNSDIVKCVELPTGDLVEIADEDMQAILAADNGSCTFIGFLDWTEFTANYSIEKPYQVRAQKVKTRANPFEKPFALIMKALEESGTVALLSYVARGRTKYAAIDSTAMMYTLRFDEEVREQRPLPEVALTDQELAMGVMVINAFKLTDPPVFSDEDSAKVMAFAQQKHDTLAAGGEVLLPTETDAPAVDAGMDLMALMQASLSKQGS